MEPLTWIVTLIAAAAVLFVLEILIPSGGLIGAAAFVSLVAAVVMMFMVDPVFGWIGLILSLFAVPAAVVLGLKVFPHTPVGKRLILADQQPTDERVRYSSDDAPASSLLGAEGVTVTGLRPVGTCKINGNRYECLAERGVIAANTTVKVVSVEGIEIKVRPV
jgi:membrane-bound ClpP family serine protease